MSGLCVWPSTISTKPTQVLRHKKWLRLLYIVTLGAILANVSQAQATPVDLPSFFEGLLDTSGDNGDVVNASTTSEQSSSDVQVRSAPSVAGANFLICASMFFSLTSPSSDSPVNVLEFVQQTNSYGLMTLPGAPESFTNYVYSFSWSNFVGILFPISSSSDRCDDFWNVSATPINQFAEAIQLEPHFLLPSAWLITCLVLCFAAILEYTILRNPPSMKRCLLHRTVRAQLLWVYALSIFSSFTLLFSIFYPWPSCRTGRTFMIFLGAFTLGFIAIYIFWVMSLIRSYIRRCEVVREAPAGTIQRLQLVHWKDQHVAFYIVSDLRPGTEWTRVYELCDVFIRGVVLGSVFSPAVASPLLFLISSVIILFMMIWVEPVADYTFHVLGTLIALLSVINGIMPLLYSLGYDKRLLPDWWYDELPLIVNIEALILILLGYIIVAKRRYLVYENITEFLEEAHNADVVEERYTAVREIITNKTQIAVHNPFIINTLRLGES
mmetsp:Transcript_6947/g.13881  ORF Transcript_6947/g.13881 Transcript_6947/m.13881 type:complete len:496 (-) Transcript_6947:6-1493(-)